MADSDANMAHETIGYRIMEANYNGTQSPTVSLAGNYTTSTNDTMGNSDICMLTTMTSYNIHIFASVSFIIIGIVGNSLSVAVFSSKEMRGNSSNVYLLVLAFSDSFYLLSVFFARTLTGLRCLFFYHVVVDFVHLSSLACQLLQYLQDLFSDFSTCLILAFTIERYIAVYLPIKFKDICTVLRARISCGLIFSVLAIFIAPYHFMFLMIQGNPSVCAISEGYGERAFTFLYLVESILFRVVPVILIAILNVFIIKKVTEISREKRKHAQRSTTVVSSTSNSADHKRKKVKRDDKSMQLTIMLILVSSSYVLLYTPVLVYFIIDYLNKTEVILNIDGRLLFDVKEYTSTLYVFGFAINFFLYTVSGRIFREQLEKIVCHHCRHREQRNGYLPAQTMTNTTHV